MDKIVPYLWYDSEAKAAVELYLSLFEDSEMIVAHEGEETPVGNDGNFYDFKLAGLLIGAFNGGPFFKLNSSISFMVYCDSKEEAQRLWHSFSDGGEELVGFEDDGSSLFFGWVKDRYGVSWQLISAETAPVKQKILPILRFSGAVKGQAKEAITYYTKIFRGRKISDTFENEERHAAHAKFEILDMEIAVADAVEDRDEPFNEAFSLMLLCDNQAEIDNYWEKLSADPEAEQCGWLKDKYGVSWQIVPANLSELLSTGTTAQMNAVTETYLPMKKLDVEKLERAWTTGTKQL